MAETVVVKGLAELAAELKSLPAKIQKNVMRKALGAAAQVIKKAAIELAPVSTVPIKRGGGRITQPGVLKSAGIIKFIRADSNDVQSEYIVTFRKGKRAQSIGKKGTNKDAFYASWVEFGHKIVPRGRTVGGSKHKRSLNKVTLRARRESSSGTVAGRRYLTRAFNNFGRQALQTFEERFRSGFDAAVK